jgi:hypothetical protein
MQNLNGWKVLVPGVVLVVLGAVNHGGTWPVADLLIGSGAIVLAIGAGLVLFASRARHHLEHLGQPQQSEPVAAELDRTAEVSSIEEHRRQVRLAFRRRRRARDWNADQLVG